MRLHLKIFLVVALVSAAVASAAYVLPSVGAGSVHLASGGDPQRGASAGHGPGQPHGGKPGHGGNPASGANPGRSGHAGNGGGSENSGSVAAPGPVAGAGLSFLLFAGAYALIRRRRKNTPSRRGNAQQGQPHP